MEEKPQTTAEFQYGGQTVMLDGVWHLSLDRETTSDTLSNDPALCRPSRTMVKIIQKMRGDARDKGYVLLHEAWLQRGQCRLVVREMELGTWVEADIVVLTAKDIEVEWKEERMPWGVRDYPYCTTEILAVCVDGPRHCFPAA